MGAPVRKPRAPKGTRTPQQARSRRTREAVLRAAVVCFEARGYDATTTAAIAAEAGVAVGTLYGYFTDKRAILLEVLDATLNQVASHVIAELEPELWREGDPRERVRALIDTVFHTRSISPGIQRILWERYFKDEGFHAAVLAIEQRIRVALERLLAALHEDGRGRVSDRTSAAFVVHAAVEWAASRLVLGEADVDADAAVAAASEMISRYLLADS